MGALFSFLAFTPKNTTNTHFYLPFQKKSSIFAAQSNTPLSP
jgi:hypothetical protein